MILKPNGRFKKLPQNYLFANIEKKIDAINSNTLIKLGIGDVILPLATSVVSAMDKAVLELGDSKTFRGYSSNGYHFLKRAIIKKYLRRGVELKENEIFVSDGAKSDLSGIVDVFQRHTAYIIAPFYPVYFDTEILKNNRVVFVKGSITNGFAPTPNKKYGSGVYYITSPNNPTGVALTKSELTAWVRHAVKTRSVIIYDNAYESFIKDDLPRSVYEIDGAETCAIEVNSLSKSAGFTGVRCGWTVIPEKLKINGENINKLWARRQSAFFNGVSYVSQRGAEAALSKQGEVESLQNVAFYMNNAEILLRFFLKKKVLVFGGRNSPYVFAQTPNGTSSERFFDALLKCGLVATPGRGFGECGEGFMRYSSFCSLKDVLSATEILSYFY